METVEQTGDDVQAMVAREPRNELERPDDTHYKRDLHVEVESGIGDSLMRLDNPVISWQREFLDGRCRKRQIGWTHLRSSVLSALRHIRKVHHFCCVQ